MLGKRLKSSGGRLFCRAVRASNMRYDPRQGEAIHSASYASADAQAGDRRHAAAEMDAGAIAVRMPGGIYLLLTVLVSVALLIEALVAFAAVLLVSVILLVGVPVLVLATRAGSQ